MTSCTLRAAVFHPVTPELSPVTCGGYSQASSQTKEEDANNSPPSLSSEWAFWLVRHNWYCCVQIKQNLLQWGQTQKWLCWPSEASRSGLVWLHHAGPCPSWLQNSAFSLGMWLFTMWPGSLPRLKQNKLSRQLVAHFYGFLMHLCKIWCWFLNLETPNTCRCSLLVLSIDSTDIKIPCWYIFSIALISRPYCQAPWTKVVVREDMAEVLITSLRYFRVTLLSHG